MESINTHVSSSGADQAILERPGSPAAAAHPTSSTLPDVEGATRRSAIQTEGSPRAPAADLAEVSKRARTGHADDRSGWPENRISTVFSGPAESAKNTKRPERAGLATQGREIPPLIPQALGHYFSQAMGTWPRERSSLVGAMTNNLRKLADLKQEPEIKQMRRELTLHWHALSEAEKSDVLEAAGTASKAFGKSAMSKPADNANVKTWLEHTAAHMPSDDVEKLFNATSADARTSLQGTFRLAGTDETRRAEVKERSADMRMTLPMDHAYDYTGFYWDNNRKIASLPKDVAEKLNVCVIGAGPAGIMTADCLNRLGVKSTVLEAEDHIGGRLATHHRTREDGTESPTATHPGGMRFHTTHGNFYWSFAEHYELKHIDFTNPSEVGAMLLLTDRVLKMEPGKDPSDPVAKKVKHDFLDAFEALMKPIRDARDAGDMATFLELSAAAKKKFDGLDFKHGVELLLHEHGIQWDEKHWETFGASGIGVGGYKGYYEVGFLEEMRFLVDGRLEKHQLLVDGADAPLKRMIADKEGLPPGGQSLEEQGAIRLSASATNVEKTPEGQFKVTWTENGERKSGTYDEVFFGASPKIAVEMGLTKQDRPDGQLVTPEVGAALEKINIVGATKMTMTVPADEFHPEELPKNLQSTAEFQQLYLHGPAKEGDSAVIYLSYTLGSNAKKVEGKSKEEQIHNLLDTLKTAAARETTDPDDKVKLLNLAALIEKHWEARSHYTHWSEVPTHGGAFKMDAPGDLDNTRTLWASTLSSESGRLRMVHEKVTYEGGFASGPFAAAVNAVLGMVTSRGGSPAKNSPLGQRLL